MELQTYGFEPAAFDGRSAAGVGTPQDILPPLPHGYAALEPGIDAWMASLPQETRFPAPVHRPSGTADPRATPQGRARAVAAH